LANLVAQLMQANVDERLSSRDLEYRLEEQFPDYSDDYQAFDII
jgi:hypothetical protein